MKQKIKSIHPFAARMAPEVAFEALSGLKKGATVLDPMVGSGTVLRTITEYGYNGIGFDIDPLAILMSKVWISNYDPSILLKKSQQVIKEARIIDLKSIELPWIDNDLRTIAFIGFWFAEKQINDLRRLSYLINNSKDNYSDVLKVALSRLIITKAKGASLAADVSHSRPHKVRESNDFDVLMEFDKVCKQLSGFFETQTVKSNIQVGLGDARNLALVPDNSISSIITSPPYLNALDYMRGHKFSLVWLGYKIDELTAIRGSSVGAEKSISDTSRLELAKVITKSLSGLHTLPARMINIIYRYALDMFDIISESKRILEKQSNAVFVIGNSCLRGVFIENSAIAANSARLAGLKVKNKKEREIPQNKRYLPPPVFNENSNLKNRMKTEVILTFRKL